jgi:YHS domain-containing protein
MTMMKAYTGPGALKTLMLCAAMALAGWAGNAVAHENHDHDHEHGGDATAAGERVGDAYPLTTCPVSGDALGSMGDPIVYVHEGREIRFCCAGCVDPFKADSAKYIEQIDAAIVEQQLALYPLTTCPVSGKELGSMGDPIKIVAGNRLVQLCCPGCEKPVKSDPAKTIEKLNAAAADAQRASYPTNICVVSEDELGGAMGEPVELVFAGRLVRLCCKGCIEDFEANPHAYLKKLDDAA